MRLDRIRIENFRCFRTFDFVPRPDVNLLVGENNSGKTSLLHALDRALGRGIPFDLDDFFVPVTNTPPAALPTVRIDLELRPTPAADFSPAFTAEFVDNIDFDATGPFLTFRTEAAFDAAESRVGVEYFSVKADGTTRRMGTTKRGVPRRLFLSTLRTLSETP